MKTNTYKHTKQHKSITAHTHTPSNTNTYFLIHSHTHTPHSLVSLFGHETLYRGASTIGHRDIYSHYGMDMDTGRKEEEEEKVVVED